LVKKLNLNLSKLICEIKLIRWVTKIFNFYFIRSILKSFFLQSLLESVRKMHSKGVGSPVEIFRVAERFI